MGPQFLMLLSTPHDISMLMMTCIGKKRNPKNSEVYEAQFLIFLNVIEYTTENFKALFMVMMTSIDCEKETPKFRSVTQGPLFLMSLSTTHILMLMMTRIDHEKKPATRRSLTQGSSFFYVVEYTT